MKLFSILAAGVAVLAATSANAATFVINNVHFADGASVSGSFTTNAALTSITNWSVSTAPGADSSLFGFPSTTPGASYSTPFIFGLGTATLTSTAVTFADGILFGNSLTLDFGAALSNAGATITGGTEYSGLFDSRSVAAGGTLANSVAAVPEPAAWGMMILGLGAVGFAMRRRQKVVTRVSYAA